MLLFANKKGQEKFTYNVWGGGASKKYKKKNKKHHSPHLHKLWFPLPTSLQSFINKLLLKWLSLIVRADDKVGKTKLLPLSNISDHRSQKCALGWEKFPSFEVWLARTFALRIFACLIYKLYLAGWIVCFHLRLFLVTLSKSRYNACLFKRA